MKISDQLKSAAQGEIRQAADELPVEDISPDRIKLLHSALPHAKVTRAWEGVHGTIVEFSLSGMQAGRLSKDHMVLLTKHPKFRWIEFYKRDEGAIGC
jgi:hypothetical protein